MNTIIHLFVSAVTHFAEVFVDNLDLLLEIRGGDVDQCREVCVGAPRRVSI